MVQKLNTLQNYTRMAVTVHRQLPVLSAREFGIDENEMFRIAQGLRPWNECYGNVQCSFRYGYDHRTFQQPRKYRRRFRLQR